MKKPQLVIFDSDGLMINTEFLWKEAYEEVAEMYNAPIIRDEFFTKAIGLANIEFKNLVEECLYMYDNRQEMVENIREKGFALIEEKTECMPGIIELLDYLDEEKIMKAVATTTPKDHAELRLKKAGLFDRFPYIVCGDQIKRRKPYPDCYLTVIEHMNVKAEDALVLEDSVYGVEAAYNAKIPCIMVPSVQKPGPKQEKEAMMIVDSLFDVLDYLKSL